MNKSEYLKALTDARKPNPIKLQDAADAGDDAAADALPVETRETPVVEAKAPVAEAPATPAAAAPVAAPATPTEPELFKGESLLDPDTRKAIRDRWEAATRLPTIEEEAKRTKEQYERLHGRMTPVQQQVSRQQLEIARLQQQLNQHQSKQTDATTQALKDRIAAIRQQFPDDAQMWEDTLNQVSAANQRAATVEEKLGQLEQRERLNEERHALTAAHPDWHKKTARIVQDETGAQVVRRTVDTTDAQEMEVWANGMDQYERQVYWPLFNSPRAQDAIALLNRFEHDRAIARQIVEQTNGGAGSAVATPGSPATPAQAALVPDPDPSRRTTAPSRSGPPGQPMSEQKRRYLDAAAYWKQQQEAKAKQAATKRR